MQNIPLKSLSVSKEYNVRKTSTSAGLEQLKASIKSHGLLENLLVIQQGNKFEVIAGGRRLTALKELSKEGDIANDYKVPCELVSSDNAEELSLAENSIREPMNPADEFEAWQKLADKGLSIADISARFAVSEDMVRKRLKLANVSKIIFQAYRDEKINLECLMAYTISDNHKHQEEVFIQLKDTYNHSPWQIKSSLSKDKYDSSDSIAKYVGLEPYAIAGGAYTQDLFEEVTYFADTELLEQLAKDKLEARAESICNNWKWVKVILKSSYEDIYNYERLYAGATEYSQEQRDISGCIVTIGYNGEEQIHEGLVLPEDSIKKQDDSSKSNSDEPTSEYSRSLNDLLSFYRLHYVKTNIAKDFELSFDVFVYQMSVKLLSDDYLSWSEDWLKISPEKFYYGTNALEKDSSLAEMEQSENEFYSKLPLDWLNYETPNERFEAFRKIKQSDKEKLFSACIARTLKPQLADNTGSKVYESAISSLEIDFTKKWRPTKDNFFNRVTKTQLLDIGLDVIGTEFVDKYNKLKKGEIVDILHSIFNEPEKHKLDKEQLKLVQNWLPEGFVKS